MTDKVHGRLYCDEWEKPLSEIEELEFLPDTVPICHKCDKALTSLTSVHHHVSPALNWELGIHG